MIMANWGIGAEVLSAFMDHSDAVIDRIVTNSLAGSKDPWRNAVAALADDNGITCDHASDWRYSDLARYLGKNIDLLVAHAWSYILPEAVFSAPAMGTINIHPSLLPKYRGPAPHLQVLKNHDRLTGLTCHKIDAGIDTGPIIVQLSTPLKGDESLDQLIDLQKPLVKPLIRQALDRLADPHFKPEPQVESQASYAPKYRK
jgi:methionyl-tRNA formyltransferase